MVWSFASSAFLSFGLLLLSVFLTFYCWLTALYGHPWFDPFNLNMAGSGFNGGLFSGLQRPGAEHSSGTQARSHQCPPLSASQGASLFSPRSPRGWANLRIREPGVREDGRRQSHRRPCGTEDTRVKGVISLIGPLVRNVWVRSVLHCKFSFCSACQFGIMYTLTIRLHCFKN